MGGEVNLITRPRRFGKTLNMSMVKYFFELDDEGTEQLFSNTKIMTEDKGDLKYMNAYPVISLMLKSMKQLNYESAFYCLKVEISREFKRHDSVLSGLKYVSDRDKYLRFVNMNAESEEYLTAIRFLSQCCISFIV